MSILDGVIGVDISYSDPMVADAARNLLIDNSIKVSGIRTTWVKDTRSDSYGFTFYEDRNKVYQLLGKAGLR